MTDVSGPLPHEFDAIEARLNMVGAKFRTVQILRALGKTVAILAPSFAAILALAGLLVAGVVGVGATWRIRVRDREARDRKADLERREKDATPLLLEGQSLVERADKAAKSGGWKDRADYARRAATFRM